MNSSKPITTNKELQAVKDVIASLLVTLKNFGLYPENHAICQKCLSNVFNHLDSLLNSYDSLKLEMVQNN